MRRKLIKHLSKERKFVEASPNHDFSIVLSHESFLAQQELMEETQHKLHKLFDRLSPRQQEVVFLKFYDNLSYREIADIMSFNDPRYARQLIYRTLEEIRSLLQESKIRLPFSAELPS